jgi:sugar-specific transcriptional regulator TrmB
MTDKHGNSLSAKMDVLVQDLISLGFTPHEAKIYIFLTKSGVNSVWHIAKELKIPRTTIYRQIANLIDKGFVVERVVGKTFRYQAVIREKFDALINNLRAEVTALEEKSTDMIEKLTALSIESKTKYKILHYRGIEGLKQVEWNCTHAKDTFRIFEIDLLHSVVDHEFAEQLRLEFAKMPIEFRQITNKTSFPDYTKVSGHIDKWRVRHIPTSLLDIKVETQVYNDVVCMFDHTTDDVFIIEIYNQKLADMYKQMFDFYWANAREMRITSRYGAAVLED